MEILNGIVTFENTAVSFYIKKTYRTYDPVVFSYKIYLISDATIIIDHSAVLLAVRNTKRAEGEKSNE